MASNIPDRHYVACWTEDDGVYFCGHKHPSVADAMGCLVPDGGSFIRACQAGVFQSLYERDYRAFRKALKKMPWRSRNGT